MFRKSQKKSKGYETDEEKAKHAAAKRWVSAVNNWGDLGHWCFHVCRDPQLPGKELEHLTAQVHGLGLRPSGFDPTSKGSQFTVGE